MPVEKWMVRCRASWRPAVKSPPRTRARDPRRAIARRWPSVRGSLQVDRRRRRGAPAHRRQAIPAPDADIAPGSKCGLRRRRGGQVEAIRVVPARATMRTDLPGRSGGSLNSTESSPRQVAPDDTIGGEGFGIRPTVQAQFRARSRWRRWPCKPLISDACARFQTARRQRQEEQKGVGAPFTRMA